MDRCLVFVAAMACSLSCGLALGAGQAAVQYAEMRRQMIAEIESSVRETAIHIDKQALDERVMQVMAEVPRHQFVAEEDRDQAYDNRPLGIGYGQTISQPYIVALMTDLLRLDAESAVLEIGTGSGYQAAVLSRLAESVYTIEIIEELGRAATERFRRLGYRNIHTRNGDGYYGWQEAAPFDAIMVTAASSHVPPALVEQLRPGGRMVIPVGGRFQVQQLMLVEKSTGGEVTTRQILPVRFVPLTGSH